MSDFIPGYSDEPHYWTNAYRNRYIRRYNVGFLRHKLSQVCRSKFCCYEYYENIAISLTDSRDVSPVSALLEYYTGHKLYWRDVGGREWNGKEWEKKYDIITEIWEFKNAKEDGYVLEPLLSDDGLGLYP